MVEVGEMSHETFDDQYCESCGRVMLDSEDSDDWFDGVCPECDRDEAPTHDPEIVNWRD
jgi:hypothetical protein